MRDNRPTCGQCEHGPPKGVMNIKCVKFGHTCTIGALACKTHFASSVDSGLRCTKCRGPMGYFEALNGGDLCAGCVNKELARQGRRERFSCRAAGIVITVAGTIWLIGAGFQRGWW